MDSITVFKDRDRSRNLKYELAPNRQLDLQAGLAWRPGRQSSIVGGSINCILKV
jgi:hypothetical protein